MPSAAPGQLVIPTFKGVEYPDSRIVFSGALDRPSLFHDERWYRCRVCGAYDGDHHLGEPPDLPALWREARNATQWRRPRSRA